MMDLMDLISRHISEPINFGRVVRFTHSGAARGPEHEDFIAFQAKVYRGHIEEIRWQGTGCPIVLSAASVVADALEGCQLVSVDTIATEALLPFEEYKRTTCLKVVKAAVEGCFNWDTKERGKCRQVNDE
jgi:NifU-like protein involved in Fe-S cluster formation